MLCRTMLFVVVALATSFSVSRLHAQGCVAIRGGAMCGNNTGNTINLAEGEFSLVSGIRHFRSYKHFRGEHEEAFRVQQGTEVINDASFLDLSVNYGITDRLFASAVLPLAVNDRSSMYEHGGNPRFDASGNLIGTWTGDRRHTGSFGLGDVRLALGYWLFEPGMQDFNYSVALGVKLPTGKYDVMDTFYNQGASKDQTIEAVVDQSIQLGDGGTGITMEVQGYHSLTHDLAVVTNLYYMSNVTETNGVLTRGATADMAADTSQFSSPDQFGARIGAFYAVTDAINVYLGGRAEGVPSSDVIGGSGGFRRPGYVISVEPGIGYATSTFTIFASTPVALYRNRTQSYIDKVRSAARGTEIIGDAAFADVLFNVGITYRFGSLISHVME